MGKEFLELLEILHISCSKCLDTKMLWKARQNNDDMKGYFMILACNMCDDGNFIDYSDRSNHYVGDKPIFHYYDIEISTRLPTLRKLYDRIMGLE